MKLACFASLAIALVALTGKNSGSCIPATNPNSPASTGDSIVAKGRGFEITRRAMDQVLATAKVNDPHHQLPPDAEVHVLAQLIEIQLVLQNATDAELAEGRRKNDENFGNIVKTMGRLEFERQLKATLMSANDLRLMLFQEQAAQTSLTRQLGVVVTDADAKKYFDDNPGVFDEPERVRIRELFLYTTSDFTTSAAPSLPQATIQARHKLIDDLHSRVLAGDDFSALAKRYNEHVISKGTGELTLTAGEIEYADQAFAMRPNQVSEVITAEDGCLFFQLLEKIPAGKAVFADVGDKIKRMLVGARKRKLAPAYIKQLWNDAQVEILDVKLKTEMAASAAEAAEATKSRSAFEVRRPAEAANQSLAKP